MNYKAGNTDAALLPVISAAVAAFLDQDTNMAVNRSQPVVACGSAWSLRGRQVLMEKRQQISVRRDKRK